MYDLITKKSEFEQSQKIADAAGKEFNVVQIEVNKERIIAGERVGWFCAGAISLSFTLIGYLFSNNDAKQILSENISGKIPLIAPLIIGWLCLMFSIIASLLVRLFNASYLNYNKAHYWTSKNRESKEKAIAAIEAGVEMIFTDADNSELAKKNISESRENFAGLEKSFALRSKIWIKATNIGLCLLSMFLIAVTYKLTYF